MSADHKIGGLAAGYVVGALDPWERKGFEEHLTSCADCARQVSQLRYVTQALLLGVEQRVPPRHLKSRILAAARAGETGPIASPGAPRPFFALWRRFPGRSVAITATALTSVALLLAVAGLVMWTFRLQDTIATQEAAENGLYQAISIMGQADRTWRVVNTEAAPNATGTLFYASPESAGCLIIWGLPQISEGSYQAWATKDGVTIRVGPMQDLRPGMWIVIPGDVLQLDAVRVTVQKAGGMHRPEGPVVASVTLANE